MWVEGGDIHDELLDQLGDVLAPPADLTLTPSPAELEALAVAVSARWPDPAVAPGTESGAVPAARSGFEPPTAPVRPLRADRRRPLRRFGSSAWRAGSVAAGLVVFSASAAAAANGGVPLPRPVRVVAYSVGLPVDSPALDDTHQHIEDLKEAVETKDKPKAQATVRRLEKDLTKVPANEKKEAEKKVVAVMEQAAAAKLIERPVPTTTTTAPPPSSTTATVEASSTTTTTAEEKSEKKDGEKKKAPATTTTAPPTTTTAEPEPATTTTTAPEADETPADSSTTTTTAPPVEEPSSTTTTTVTTAPPPDDTPTTTSSSSTTTTTSPPANPGAGVRQYPEDVRQHPQE